MDPKITKFDAERAFKNSDINAILERIKNREFESDGTEEPTREELLDVLALFVKLEELKYVTAATSHYLEFHTWLRSAHNALYRANYSLKDEVKEEKK